MTMGSVLDTWDNHSQKRRQGVEDAPDSNLHRKGMMDMILIKPWGDHEKKMDKKIIIIYIYKDIMYIYMIIYDIWNITTYICMGFHMAYRIL